MRFKIDDSIEQKTLKKAMVSVPKSIYATNIFGNEIDVDKIYCAETLNNDTYLSEMWDKPHPLMHTWLILSSVSICFLSALLFIIH